MQWHLREWGDLTLLVPVRATLVAVLILHKKGLIPPAGAGDLHHTGALELGLAAQQSLEAQCC